MKHIRNAFDKLNGLIPESLRQISEFLANIVTIAVPIGGAGYTVINLVSNKDEEASGLNPENIIIIILAVSIVALFIRFRNHKKSFDNERTVTSRNYYSFLHDYRNVINEIEKSYKENKLTESFLHKSVEDFLENALDYLTETLTIMTGQKVCGCVKLIMSGNGLQRISYKDVNVKTFARSKNTNSKRKSNDVKTQRRGVPIRENTDFMSIVADDRNGNDSYFYQQNLKEYDKLLRKTGGGYKNTTEHWDEYYIGTIVVPIRIANSRLFYTVDDDSYCIWGFLCVDSLSKKAFPVEQESNYTNIMKAYAASLFNILSKYQFYLSKLNNLNSTRQTLNMQSNNGQRNQNSSQRNKSNRNRRRK